MYHYEYVSKAEAAPYKQEFLDIIHETQDLLRDSFTFSYDFIGSSSRNMITCDYKTNKGFDFDVNFHVNDEDEEYTPKEIKLALIRALNKVALRRGFSPCEDSTRVITLKKHFSFASRIEYSCDFAIVYDYTDKSGRSRQQYIKFKKKQNEYVWEEQPKGYRLLEKETWITEHKLKDELRKIYLDKKNYNTNPDKKSRALYAESVHEVCQMNGY